MSDDVSVVDQPVTVVVDQQVVQVGVSVTGVVVEVTNPDSALTVLDTPAGQIQVFTAVGGAGGIPHSEEPSGTVNGINAVFTLSSIPVANSLILLVNGLVQISGFSRIGQTVTFDSDAIPQAGDQVFAFYSR